MTKYIALLTAAVLVVIDQLIKIWAQATLLLLPRQSMEIIPNFFYLTYIQNFGAAFGIFQGKTVFLTIIVSLVLVLALYFMFSGKIRSQFLLWSVALIIAGGAGNLIDRVMRGYVVDYLDFRALFGFPVFNFADCCVVIGTFMILFYILFLDRAEKQANLFAPSPDETAPEETLSEKTEEA